jgi:hypothetical protein
VEMISSRPEHTRKCSKVEYLCRIIYDFQKSRVTVSWDQKVSVSAKKNSCLCTFNRICVVRAFFGFGLVIIEPGA